MERFEIFRNIEKTFKESLKEKDFETCKDIISNIFDYYELEQIIREVLYKEKINSEIIDSLLQAYLDCWKPIPEEHGYWVHSLSHFDNYLWKYNLKDWIKKLYNKAFTYANEYKNYSCCNRLLYSFLYLSDWSDDSSDFGISLESTSWMKWKPYNTNIYDRIKIRKYNSPNDYLDYLFDNPEMLMNHEGIPDINKIHTLIYEISKEGGNICSYIEKENELLKEILQKIQTQLKAEKYDSYKYKELEKIRWAIKWIIKD